jgi:signal transduction histidine kinase/DNA-binding response OmpR family regulator
MNSFALLGSMANSRCQARPSGARHEERKTDTAPEFNPQQGDPQPGDWLAGCGEMGKLVRATDWSQTPLGPIESWPQSLRTTVSLGLASNFPISLVWGPKHVQIYNDGYWPICGGKHPHSMGQDFSECWASAWPVIGEAFERALAGETSYLEDQRMFLDRNGYLEETFFTFSFSPIRDETGGVGGLFHPVTETTAKMVGERRTRALRDLAARAGKSKTTEEALTLAAQTLSEFDLDIPFALFYLLDSTGKQARLVANAGGLPQSIAAPSVNLEALHASVWPLDEVARTNQAIPVEGLETRCGAFSCGPYPETPKTALALPITMPGSEHPTAIVVAGVSSRLPLNDTYRAFYDFAAAAITSAVANARAYEEECRRAEALAEIDRAKTAFFSNVSHEFRTPLTLMLGPLEDELAECSDPLSPARRARLETAHRSTLRLLKLVNTLLDFSRIEAGRVQASYEPIDLSLYTAELASVFRSAIEKVGLTLTVDCAPLPELIYVDKDMWEKIVLNLLSNALKHTFEGGIRVGLKWRGDHVEFAVTDSGVGIPETELPHLFDRFHRVKGAKSRTHEGTGIGLALVHELAHAHGGTVTVDSRESHGSTFTVVVKTGTGHLPAERLGAPSAQTSAATLATAYVGEASHWISEMTGPSAQHPPSGETTSSSNLPEPTATTAGVRSRILWADDNADMRDYVGRLLAERYEVTAVPDGVAALESALLAPPDLVLTDVMMPGLDGFGLLRELRANERTQTIPVILLSARAGEESAVEGLQAGADDYLVKPFSARELLTRVQTHLDLSKLRREWAATLELQVHERTAELKQAEQKLREQLHRLNLLHHIARATGERQDLRSIFQVVIRALEDEMPVDFGCVCLYDPIDEVLTVASVGVRSRALATELAMTEQARIDIDENGLSLCASGQLVYEPDIGGIKFPFPQRLARGGLRSLVAVPLLVERKTLGIFIVAREQPASFSSGECEFLSQLSEHVALAAHQAQLHATLQDAYDDLRRTQQAALQQERLRALGQMASGIAHDINNAISPVSLYTDSLLESEPNLTARTRRYLEIVKRVVNDVTATISRMREFYRERTPQVTLAPVDLNQVVQDVAELTSARWSDMPQQRGIVITMRRETAPDLPVIMGIDNEVREALTNLVFNAVDAMPDGGVLTVRTKRIASQAQRTDPSATHVYLEVSDTGVGMDEATKRRCLEPFFTTKGERGTGLGLAMVYGAVQRHGAEIEIDSTVGEGTTFRLVFPVPSGTASAVVEAAISQQVPTQLRILLVDDDPFILDSMRTVLELDGHVVTEANGGQAGIDAVHAAQDAELFDVVITDLGMPYVDGNQVARAVRELSSTTRIILLTGWGRRLSTDNTESPHVDYVLAKPPQLHELRETLAQCSPLKPCERRMPSRTRC